MCNTVRFKLIFYTLTTFPIFSSGLIKYGAIKVGKNDVESMCLYTEGNFIL